MPSEDPKDPTPRELVPPYPRHPYFTDGAGQQLRADGGAHAFRHEARGFELVNAWWLAEAAALVYDEEPFVSERFAAAGLPEVALFDRAGTQCYVAANDRFAVVAFRGTQSGARSLKEIREIVLDIEADKHFLLTPFGPGGSIHRGFAAAVAAVWDDAGGLRSHLAGLAGGRSLWFTGHSLGAANATVAALLSEHGGLRVSGLYTYGSPRVGNAAFTSRFRESFPGDSGPEHQRFVNGRDIVTRVPPEQFGYRHVGAARHVGPHGTTAAEAAQTDATPAELGRELNDTLLQLIPESIRRLVAPAARNLGLRLSERVERLIDKAIESLPHDLIDRALLDHAPEPLKHHVPTMYADGIWNAYVRTLAVKDEG